MTIFYSSIKSDITPKVLTKYDIEYIINSFSEVAYKFNLVVFYDIKIHGAHGYLLGQFLDPYHK